MTRQLVFAVGNEMMGDDAAGPLLAQMLKDAPLEQWDVLDGGSVPENHLFKVREMAPERVIIVDAAEMDLPTGEVRLVERDQIGSLFLMSTHSLPLTFLMEAMQEFVPEVGLIGIQPGLVGFAYPMSPEVTQAVKRVYGWLALQNAGDSIAVTAPADAKGGTSS